MAEDGSTGLFAEDILLSDSDDSDYSVTSANIESFDQINVNVGDSQTQSMYDISDEWEHCRHIDGVSHLDVHILPELLDPNEMPEIYVAMLDLMDRTSGCSDLGIFDKIMEWAVHFSVKFPGVFSNIGSNLKTKREPFLNNLRSMFPIIESLPSPKWCTQNCHLVNLPQFLSFRSLKTCYIW